MTTKLEPWIAAVGGEAATCKPHLQVGSVVVELPLRNTRHSPGNMRGFGDSVERMAKRTCEEQAMEASAVAARHASSADVPIPHDALKDGAFVRVTGADDKVDPVRLGKSPRDDATRTVPQRVVGSRAMRLNDFVSSFGRRHSASPTVLGAPPDEEPSDDSNLGIIIGVGALAAGAVAAWMVFGRDRSRGAPRSRSGASSTELKIAQAHPNVAQSFADDWSPALKDVWPGGISGRGRRSRSRWMPLHELHQLFLAICPAWNDFSPDRVYDVFRKFGDGAFQYQAAYEDGPVIYVRKARHGLEDVPGLKDELMADKVTHTGRAKPVVVRFWWD